MHDHRLQDRHHRFRLPHARAAIRVGALCAPGTTVLITIGATSRSVSAASQRPVPAPRPTIPPTRICLNEASTKGSHAFARPIFPSLWPPGWNGPPLGLNPGLRTPPTRSRTTHAEVGTGHRAGGPILQRALAAFGSGMSAAEELRWSWLACVSALQSRAEPSARTWHS
jgi:hypothetical protein